jgi:PilZ domain
MQEPPMQERREHTREHTDWLSEVYADDTIYTSPVRNLSLGGVELMRSPLWKPKQDHILKISLSDMVPDHTLEVRMQVCWVTNSHVGLKFHELSFKQKIKLNKILSTIARTIAFEDGHFVM